MRRAAYSMGVGQGYLGAKYGWKWYPDAVIMWKLGIIVGYIGGKLRLPITVLR